MIKEENKVDISEVKKLYDEMETIWPESDLWHTYTHNFIKKYLKRELFNLKPTCETKILNAGSAGNTYNVMGEHYHVDISYNRISHLKNSVEASIEALPHQSNFFDGCICMGSVINYCDAIQSIFEFSRVLKSGAFLVIDFEQSRSFQFLFSKEFNKKATIINTFNSGEIDKLWVYSPNYIFSILNEAGFVVKRKEFFHILSPFVYKITKNENKASYFSKLDKFAKYIPLLKKCSCNVIITCQKV